MNEPLITPEALPVRERPELRDLTDYAHLLPEEFVDFVNSVEGWNALDFESLLEEIAHKAAQKELTPWVRDGIERVERIQQIRNMDIEGGNSSIERFLVRVKNPRIPSEVHDEVVNNLRNVFNCENIFDVYVVGIDNLKMATNGTNETINYIYEFLVRGMISEVERLVEEDIQREQAEGADNEADAELEAAEAGKDDVVHVGGDYVLDKHIHHPRKWFSKIALVIAMILAGVVVERGYIHFDKIFSDARKAYERVLWDDTPKAIQVSPEQMRELEKRERQ